MIGRNNSFTVFQGSAETITVVIQDNNGNPINLTNTTTYATVSLNVWTPSGTLLINSAGSYGTRASGQVQYTFSPSSDTTSANTGNWTGIFICYNNSGVVSQYSDVFNVTIEAVGSG